MRLICWFFIFLLTIFRVQSLPCEEIPCRKVLFIMTKLEVGGAEQAFISLLNNWSIPNTKVEVLLLGREGILEPRLKKDFPIISIQEGLSRSYDAVVSFGEWIDPRSYLRKISAKRKVQWIHTDMLTTNTQQWFSKTNLCEGIDAFVCVSDRAAESFRKVQPQLSKKITAIYSVCDAELIRKLSRENIPSFPKDGLCNVVSVGRLHSSKAFDRAIRVHSRLDKKRISFRWYIVGEGIERPKLEQQIRKYGLQKKFILLGKKLNPYPYMVQADIVAMPSLFEGWCLAVTEAKILRRPILFTDVAGAREQIQSEKNGLIVANNEDAIYHGLKRLLQDPALRKRFSDALQGFGYDNGAIYNNIEKVLFIPN